MEKRTAFDYRNSRNDTKKSIRQVTEIIYKDTLHNEDFNLTSAFASQVKSMVMQRPGNKGMRPKAKALDMLMPMLREPDFL